MVKKNIKKETADRHWGISVLAILHYIGATFLLVSGIAMLFGASVLAALFVKIFPQLADASYLAGIMLFVGIMFIPFAILSYFVGRGLWKGQNWARIVVIVLSVFSILTSLRAIFANFIGILIDALIIWYLGFYKPAVDYFK